MNAITLAEFRLTLGDDGSLMFTSIRQTDGKYATLALETKIESGPSDTLRVFIKLPFRVNDAPFVPPPPPDYEKCPACLLVKVFKVGTTRKCAVCNRAWNAEDWREEPKP